MNPEGLSEAKSHKQNNHCLNTACGDYLFHLDTKPNSYFIKTVSIKVSVFTW